MLYVFIYAFTYLVYMLVDKIQRNTFIKIIGLAWGQKGIAMSSKISLAAEIRWESIVKPS